MNKNFLAGAGLGALFMVTVGAWAALGGPDQVRLPYHGRLEEGGAPANGTYTFRFTVHDAESGGTACGAVPDVVTTVAAGEFGVIVGPVAESCVLGKPVWLSVAVRSASAGGFTQLQGRQRVYPTLSALTSGLGDFSVAGLLNVTGLTNLRGSVDLPCTACGSTTTLDGNQNFGRMTVQGRVLSANSNIHLSPPSGFSVVINDDYRAAGGVSTGEAGLLVEGRVTAGYLLGAGFGANMGQSYTAGSDGFVYASIGVVDAGFYCGTHGHIRGTAGGAIRGQAAVNAHCSGVDYPNLFDSFLMPVRRGETWRVDESVAGAGNLQARVVTFIPLGSP